MYMKICPKYLCSAFTGIVVLLLCTSCMYIIYDFWANFALIPCLVLHTVHRSVQYCFVYSAVLFLLRCDYNMVLCGILYWFTKYCDKNYI